MQVFSNTCIHTVLDDSVLSPTFCYNYVAAVQGSTPGSGRGLHVLHMGYRCIEVSPGILIVQNMHIEVSLRL